MDVIIPTSDDARREANERAIEDDRRNSVQRRDNQDWDRIHELLLKSDIWKKHLEMCDKRKA